MDNEHDFYKPEKKYSLNLISRIGYRYQKESGGILFRMGWTPYFSIYSEQFKGNLIELVHFGFSLGYTFKTKE